jgi:hypothetical protein
VALSIEQAKCRPSNEAPGGSANGGSSRAPKRHQRKNVRATRALGTLASCAALIVFITSFPVFAQSSSFDDCHINTRSYFLAAKSLGEEAAMIGNRGSEVVARDMSAALAFYEQAKQKREEANRLRSRGQRERLECFARARTAADERQKEKFQSKLHGQSHVDLAKTKVEIKTKDIIKNFAGAYRDLRAAKGDFRASLAVVTDRALELRKSVSITGPGYTQALMISKPLTTATLKANEQIVTEAIAGFQRAMDRVKQVRVEYDAQPPQPAPRPSPSVDQQPASPAPSRPQTDPPRPARPPPQVDTRQDGECRLGWRQVRDARGQVFCRCGANEYQYVDPRTVRTPCAQ